MLGERQQINEKLEQAFTHKLRSVGQIQPCPFILSIAVLLQSWTAVAERDLMVHKAKLFTIFPLQKSLQTPDSLDNVHNIDMSMNKLLISKKLNQKHRAQSIKILAQFGQPAWLSS